MLKRFVKKARNLSIIMTLVIVLLSSCSLIINKTDRYAEAKKSATNMAETFVTDYGLNSLQYALLYQNNVILSGNASKYNDSNSLTIADSSIYGIGSTSKMFTTVAIMLLVDQNKLDLDEPVTTYVPDFVMEDMRYKDITIRMLLNHSSGLMGSTFTNSFLFDDSNTYNHDNLLKMLAKQKLKADPGAFSVYCNDGFSLAELVVERVSGLTFSEFIRINITKPLNLRNTFTPQDDFDRNLMAKTFIRGNETPPENVNVIGTGGIYSTALELCLFGQIFMENSNNDKAKDFLSTNSIETLMEKEYLRGMWPEQKDNSFNYGLGWDSVELYPFNRYEIQAIAKGGDTYLYHSSLIVIPKQNIVFAAVMSGGSSIIGEIMGISLLQQVLLASKKIKKILPYDQNESTVVPMPSELIDYSGIYAENNYVKKIEIEQNGTLNLTILTADLPVETYHYYSSGEFMNEDKSKALSFVKEENGEIYLRIIQTLTLPGVGKTVITEYDSVKILPNLVDINIQQTWDNRSGTYYILNEISSGLAYFNLTGVTLELSTFTNLPGYIGTYRIIDINNAIQNVQIPVMNGRDNDIIRFDTENGQEFLSNASWTFISEKDIPIIPVGKEVICTIEQNGYACWYFVAKEDTGKTMTVNLPNNGAFAVYDNSNCIYFSRVSGNLPVILPEDGKIVFIGDVPGSIFHIMID